MDDKRPADRGCLAVQRPHWQRTPAAVPPALVPLRLLLKANSLSIEVTQPDSLVARHTEADVRLPLPDISRRHCRLVCSEGTWQIFDLNSLNGIYVNGERVQHATLHHRDVLG